MIEELKNMNIKDLCIWVSKAKSSDLRLILKNNKIKGFSKLNKAELLNKVLDIVLEEQDIEVMDDVEIVDGINNDIPKYEVFDDVKTNYNIENIIKGSIKSTISIESLCNYFSGVKNKQKPQEEYIKNAIEKETDRFNRMHKNIEEIKKYNITAENKLNNIFINIGSGLRADSLIIDKLFTKSELYLRGKNVLYDISYSSLYIPYTDDYIILTEEYDGYRDWLDECQEDGTILSKDVYNNKDVIYLFEDDKVIEIPLFVEEEKMPLIEQRITLLNSNTTEIINESGDYIIIKDNANYVNFYMDIDELIYLQRCKKGQTSDEFRYISKKALDKLDTNIKNAIKEFNKLNNKLLK